MTSTYELMVVLVPSLREDQQKKAFLTLEKTVSDRGGKVVSSDVWGKRELAYPIKKQTEGIYGLWMMELSVEGPAALENYLRVNEEVLRHLLTKTKSSNNESRIKTKKIVKKISKKKGK